MAKSTKLISLRVAAGFSSVWDDWETNKVLEHTCFAIILLI